MTPDERNALFERIVALQDVKIDHALERGRNYLMDRLQDCRQRTDEIGQITVRVKRALFEAKVARRNAKALARLDPKRADDYQQAEDSYDELKAIEEACNVARGTLRAADSDIRLAGTLLGIQIGLGQFRPGDNGTIPSPEEAQRGAPSSDPAATAPVTDAPDEPAAANSGIDLVGLLAPEETIDARDTVPERPKGAGHETRTPSTTTIDEAPAFSLDDLLT